MPELHQSQKLLHYLRLHRGSVCQTWTKGINKMKQWLQVKSSLTGTDRRFTEKVQPQKLNQSKKKCIMNVREQSGNS